MPTLPSGLNLAISRDSLFDHGGNWFDRPDGHFWYWAAGPEAGSPPFDLGARVLREARHAPVPTSRDEMKQFIYVLEMTHDGLYSWRGEWLAHFPQYVELDDRDLRAWNAWLSRPETDRFLDETIDECRRLAEVSRHVTGYAVLENSDDESAEDGWVAASLQKPVDARLRKILRAVKDSSKGE